MVEERSDARKSIYLQNAAVAEAQVTRTDYPELRKPFLEIAKLWREMAEEVDKRPSATSRRGSPAARAWND
jgi:hypothetical protein